MTVKPTVESPAFDDLKCPLGGAHTWDYIRGDVNTKQEAVYKCSKCQMVVSKIELKKLTDGGI